MNWKYQIGKYLSRAEKNFIKLNLDFARSNFPYGRNWIFDIHRILKKEAHVIIDAGANIGSVSLELNFWFPGAEIYAFEPVKDTFNSLVKNTLAKSNINPLHLGLGSKRENLEILLSV